MTPIPYQPGPSDNLLQRGRVWVDDISIHKADISPAMPLLNINGSMPTPCHRLRIVPAAVITNGQINLEVYSLSNPQEICVQMIESFSTEFPTKELYPGDYSVFINGEENLRFHWPI